MSRRDRGDRRAGTGTAQPSPARPPAGPATPDVASTRNAVLEPAPPNLRERLGATTLPAGATLPLRFFFGITFLYAGIDKLIDPTFFDASSPTSIMAQMAQFARVSPLAPLVTFGQPFALLIGLAIAFAEIAIGLGALTGLAFRVAAAGGAVLSLLFFLTASWSTRPYYFGPDLPYAAGWLTLALAGTGGLLVPRWVRDLDRLGVPARRASRRTARGDRRTPRPAGGWTADEPGTLTRRTLIQVGILGGAALLVGTASVPLRLLRGRDAGKGIAGTPTPAPGTTPTPGATPAPGASRAPATSPAPSAAPTTGSSNLAVAKTSDFASTSAVAITVPVDAPQTLPAGDPGVIVKLPNGSYVGYDAVCTHQGCTVEWDGGNGVLVCPCHGAAFDPASNAQVLQGPARRPLPALPLVVDKTTGTISLKA